MNYDGFTDDVFNLLTEPKEITSIRSVRINLGFENYVRNFGTLSCNKNIENIIQSELHGAQTNFVPFMPLERLNSSQELHEAKKLLTTIIDTGQFTSGKYVGQVKKEIKKYFNITNCIATSSGTDGLIIALRACGIGPGDEVILPSNSFAATENAVFSLLARPVYADVDNDFNINPEAVLQAITPKTKAIVPVCLYGRLPQLSKLVAIAKSYNIFTILDEQWNNFVTNSGYNISVIDEIENEANKQGVYIIYQHSDHQGPYKASYYYRSTNNDLENIEIIKTIASKKNVLAKITICNPAIGDPPNCYDVDFIPECCGKEKIAAFITHKFCIIHSNTFAFGDSCNDLSMLYSVNHGYLVGNAEVTAKKVFLKITNGSYCFGILEGLKNHLPINLK